MTPAQLLSALAAVRHYARHEGGCPHAHMRESTGGYWASVCGLPPARIILVCSCGLDDTLRGIEAMLAGRDVGDAVASKTETPQPESSACGCGIVRTAGDWPEDLALENGNYCCRCATCFRWFQGHKRRFLCKVCAGNPSVTPNSSTTTDKESDDGN